MLALLQLAQLTVVAAPQPASVAHITTTSAMRDGSGAPITDCLEPHIQKFGDTFYAVNTPSNRRCL
jgi:hypothetical protein